MSKQIDEFLRRNSVGVAQGVQPLVHTTKSFNLREIIQKAGLTPSKCDVYDEELLYFFVGRPAYQWQKDDGSPRDWELPTCFVFDDMPSLNAVRTMPFDSGAHANKRYPSYINDLNRKNFECSAQDASRRIISAFYGNFRNYVAGKPKTFEKLKDEFSLGPLDTEVLALHALAEDASASKTDDRRFSIEIQSKDSVSFADCRPAAVILPTVYLRDEAAATAISEWGCEVLNYDTYGLSMASYFGQVFLKFTDYCRAKKLL